MVASVAIVAPVSVRCSPAGLASSCICACRAGCKTALISSKLCLSLGACRSVYVGRRLTNLPRLGMKREFWTFVSDVRVCTSGSGRVSETFSHHATVVPYQGCRAHPPSESDNLCYRQRGLNPLSALSVSRVRRRLPHPSLHLF